MKAFCQPDIQKLHDPEHFLVNGVMKPCPEQPVRVDALISGAQNAGLDIIAPADHGLSPIAGVHTPEYLRFLSTIHGHRQHIDGASQDVIPGLKPNRYAASYPRSAVGQAGFHMADPACPVGKDTWQAVCMSAHCAVSATDDVLAGAKAAYALCRPPGHHAYADMAGGFCYVNNSAVAAQRLRQSHDRVAILDVDLHHGNGTQGIFYGRNDVLTVSIHADPARFYPFFWGHAHERGKDAGEGYNLNLPLTRGSGDDLFLKALGRALEQIALFAPGGLVIALGLDAFEGDPFGGLAVSTDGFRQIGKTIHTANLPTVIIQEGGYLCDELGDNLTAFFDGFMA